MKRSLQRLDDKINLIRKGIAKFKNDSARAYNSLN